MEQPQLAGEGVPEHREQPEQEEDAAAMPQAALDAQAAALAAAQAAALPQLDFTQLQNLGLDLPQLGLENYAGMAVPGQINLMPAITTLIMQITQHLSQPNGNPQLALTFQPLVNMALQLQLQASAADMSAVNYLALAAGGGMPAVANGLPAAGVQFDPQVLMASAMAAAGDSSGGAFAQQPQQVQRGGGGGRRRQRAEAAEEEDEEDTDWRRSLPSKSRQSGSSGGSRPQRQRRKSKLLQEYLTDEEEA